MSLRPKVALWFDRIMFFSFLPLAFFLPIGKALVEIFATIIIVCYFLKRIIDFVFQIREHTKPVSNPFHFWLQRFLATFKPVRTPLRAAVSFLIFTHVLSIVASDYQWLGWKAFFGKTIENTFLFFSLIECLHTQRRLLLLLWSFLGSVLLVGVDGIFQYVFKFDFIFHNLYSSDGRVSACFSHPNDFGSYLIVVVPLCLSLFVWSQFWKPGREAGDPLMNRSRLGWAAVILFVLSLTCLGLTFSRGAWIAFVISMMFVAITNFRKVYFPALVIVLFFVIFYPMIGPNRNVTFVTDDIIQERIKKADRENRTDLKVDDVYKMKLEMKDTKFLLKRFSGTGRSVFWQEALDIFLSSPVVGTGLNTYMAVVPKFKIAWGQYPHNCYLQMAAETGILGLGGFLWVMGALSTLVWKSLKTMVSSFHVALVVGLFAGILAFWVHGALDTNFYSLSLGNLMWIVMGWIVAIIRLDHHPH